MVTATISMKKAKPNFRNLIVVGIVVISGRDKSATNPKDDASYRVLSAKPGRVHPVLTTLTNLSNDNQTISLVAPNVDKQKERGHHDSGRSRLLVVEGLFQEDRESKSPRESKCGKHGQHDEDGRDLVGRPLVKLKAVVDEGAERRDHGKRENYVI